MKFDNLFFKIALKCKVVHSIPGRMRINIPLTQKIPSSWKGSSEKLFVFLKKIPGIQDVSFNYATGNALILYDDQIISEKEILDALNQLGSLLYKHRDELSRFAAEDQDKAIDYLMKLLEMHLKEKG